jgi:hypothetical protein
VFEWCVGSLTHSDAVADEAAIAAILLYGAATVAIARTAF